jgi:hypothetical protein
LRIEVGDRDSGRDIDVVFREGNLIDSMVGLRKIDLNPEAIRGQSGEKPLGTPEPHIDLPGWFPTDLQIRRHGIIFNRNIETDLPLAHPYQNHPQKTYQQEKKSLNR